MCVLQGYLFFLIGLQSCFGLEIEMEMLFVSYVSYDTTLTRHNTLMLMGGGQIISQIPSPHRYITLYY